MSELQETIDDAIELFDLGDATVETRQWYIWPIWFDSVFGMGQKDG